MAPGSSGVLDGMSVLPVIRRYHCNLAGTLFPHPLLTAGEDADHLPGAIFRFRQPRSIGISMPEQRVDAYSWQLSGGLRQRAMIAMALSCRPRLLIADEPTTAIDVTTQAQILAPLRELQHNCDAAIIFITHDLAVIA
jgi:predicted ABC-type transport system involved in lysophospholipase L1 biosynthesis ATPase subunit